MIYGIQSLFQSLNIEVQDVSPDVATRHGSGQYFAVAIRDKPYVKNNRYPFSSAYFYLIPTKKWSKT
ncbi:hypothetical protein AH448_22050 [Salmonella enterica subsp. diarizonae]|uniref:Uncharacterized protein n=6 Tax=Salmonella enterica TaxID=28901 RepID=A0A2I5HND1_SALDZ|nr:hypothetical protein LFZ53_24705 [Salmonella enterica subsp. diarizonae serovar 50:k:z str. MZ0080]ASG85660.1 hypothetical protein LFZ55_23725 [Salmonella enterica subsp. diarizonae serovar 65:c:z str. SA20044251]ATW57008.1 hypothetical protein CNQ75_22345 [Salmonella enterica subsp. diarizonae]AXC68020.1 hypothetical protein DOE63_22610 [Salmonella enterica subsp. diarizonae serovar 59:z10:-]AXC74736.1 hypothetical protein DOE59_26445 [Salmonella enterica subsp. diarizonae serovar 48:i:z]A